jgi:hypothetical protein
MFRQLKQKVDQVASIEKASLYEYLHSANNTRWAYPIGTTKPSVFSAIKKGQIAKIDARAEVKRSNLPNNYQFFDYYFDQETDTLNWKPTLTKQVYDAEYFEYLIKILETIKKPWVIKTFPASFITNKSYRLNEQLVRDMLVRLNKISHPVILKREFKPWIISLYFSTKYQKYTKPEMTTEFLNKINVEHVIPQQFIDFYSNYYHIFHSLVDSLFPNETRYDVKDIFADTDKFLTDYDLPIINSNASEYSKLDYRTIIKNYDDIKLSHNKASLLSPFHV